MKLHEIAEQKALKVAEMRSLLSADKLNAEGQAKFDALKTQVTDLEGQEARARFLDDAERRSMGEPDAQHRDNATLESRVSISRILQSQMEGRSLTGAEAEFSQEAERRNGVVALLVGGDEQDLAAHGVVLPAFGRLLSRFGCRRRTGVAAR